MRLVGRHGLDRMEEEFGGRSAVAGAGEVRHPVYLGCRGHSLV